jgi:phage terminase small subunit
MKDSTFKKYCLVVDEWTVNGFNGTRAYKKFYPDSSDETSASEFIKILRIPKVLEYKEKILKDLSNNLHITRETQVLDLNRLKSLAEDAEKYSDAINALKEQNKLLAFYELHNAQKTPDMTTEERAKRIADLKSKIK